MTTKAQTELALPDTDQSYLIETGDGLRISRRKSLKALRPSLLSVDALNELLRLLDKFVEAKDREDALRHRWVKAGFHSGPESEEFRNAVIASGDDQKSERRQLIKPLKAVRTSRAKNLDDILFKAYLAEILDSYDCWRETTLGYSIVNDLLSSDCHWRAS